MTSKIDVATMRHTATAWDRTVLRRGIAAALVGAFVVAGLFLVFDLAAGQPFHTPAVLGARLFLDSAYLAGATALLPVLAYSAVHTVIFIAIGLIAAVLASDLDANRRLRSGLIATAGLFAAMEAVFLSFAMLFDPSLLEELGWGRVALGNLLAAASMAAVILGVRPDPETRP